MSNIRAALVEAVYTALNVSSVTDLAPVFQHAIEDTQPPCVIIRTPTLEDVGGKDGGLYRATVDIETYYRGTKGTSAAAIIDAVEAALLATGFVANGILSDRVTVTTVGPTQGEDGVTYDATVTATALVQPA